MTSSTSSSSVQTTEKKKTKSMQTRVVIHCDVGFNNSVSIRGSGAGLSWNKGKPLLNTQHDKWVWETDKTFEPCECKVLINDTHYELGDNHALICKKELDYTPRFAG